MEYHYIANSDALTLLERIQSDSTTLIYFDPPTGFSDKCDINKFRQLYLHATCHAKRILKDNGVLVWHVLPECVLDVRNCLNRVFGADLFAFEIVLKRRRLANSTVPTTNHTSLLVFSKTNEFQYLAPTRLITDSKKLFSQSDENGPYRLGDLTTLISRPSLKFVWNGHTPPNGRSWRYSQSKLDEMFEAGRILIPDLKLPREKIYLSEHATEEIGSVWDDIDLPPAERVKYYSNGQQSLTLMSRILEMLTNEHDLVVDPFCGTGTTLVAATQLGRKWIGSDSSQDACAQAIARLQKTECEGCKLVTEEDVRRLSVKSSLTDLLRTLPKLTESRHVDIHQLVISPESKTLEFKQTLSVDIRTKEKAKYMETNCLKTIAGFLNSDGGTLLVGVTDDSKPVGVMEEINSIHKGSEDKFLLHFKSLVKEHIGEEFYPLLDYHLVAVDGNPILRVDCKESNRPCFIGDDFYVRTNPATDKLAGPTLLKYISTRFPNNLA